MHRLEIRFYGDLLDLAGAAELEVPIGTPRSIKDVVESCGVPHPELGLLLVGHEPVDLAYLLVGGERVAAYPPFRTVDLSGVTTVEPPTVEPRFVLDVHLGTLTRRLRLLGFDCWYRTDADDRLLAHIAAAQTRILLTRDRGLLMRRTVTHGYCPRSDDPEEQALEVVARYDLARRLEPATRCVACNGPLRRATREEVFDDLPPRTRREHDTFSRCEGCGRIYWPGSHIDALRGFLDRAASGGSAPT